MVFGWCIGLERARGRLLHRYGAGNRCGVCDLFGLEEHHGGYVARLLSSYSLFLRYFCYVLQFLFIHVHPIPETSSHSFTSSTSPPLISFTEAGRIASFVHYPSPFLLLSIHMRCIHADPSLLRSQNRGMKKPITLGDNVHSSQFPFRVASWWWLFR